MEDSLSRQLAVKERGLVEELGGRDFFFNGKARVAAQPQS